MFLLSVGEVRRVTLNRPAHSIRDELRAACTPRPVRIAAIDSGSFEGAGRRPRTSQKQHLSQLCTNVGSHPSWAVAADYPSPFQGQHPLRPALLQPPHFKPSSGPLLRRVSRRQPQGTPLRPNVYGSYLTKEEPRVDLLPRFASDWTWKRSSLRVQVVGSSDRVAGSRVVNK
jgi:hypothetical protein